VDAAPDHGRARGGRRRAAVPAYGLAILLVAGALAWVALPLGVTTASSGSPARSIAPVPDSSPPAAAGFVVAPATTLRKAPEERVAPRPGVPRSVVIPALDLRAPVVGITADGRTLTPPSDPQKLGWWSPGARPGAARGSALITGHTVSAGGGALDDLEQVRVGDRVRVGTTRGNVEYAVRDVAIYRRASLARQAEKLFNQTGPARLVLVTCEDWNGEVYLSNVVVIAEPLTQ
jgi:LPXTG-site transpeptidase (sortase) family protein